MSRCLSPPAPGAPARPTPACSTWRAFPTTVPTSASYVADSPYVLRGEDDGGWGIYEGRPAARRRLPRAAAPLLRPDHGRRHPLLADRPAAPGLRGQHGAADLRLLGQRRPVPVLRHRRHPRRGPHHREEDPGACSPRWLSRRSDLDGAVDATLTTGSTATPDRGALYVARCAAAVKEAVRPAGPGAVRAARRPRRLDQVADLGIDSVGIHVETFDPAVLARVAPGKARWGIETYFAAWERAVAAFGAGPGVHLRHPRHGRGPRDHRRGLQARHRPGRLPVRRAAAARCRAASWRTSARRPGGRRVRLPPGRPPPRGAGHVAPPASRPAARAARPARACDAFERSDGGLGDGRPSLPLSSDRARRRPGRCRPVADAGGARGAPPDPPRGLRAASSTCSTAPTRTATTTTPPPARARLRRRAAGGHRPALPADAAGALAGRPAGRAAGVPALAASARRWCGWRSRTAADAGRHTHGGARAAARTCRFFVHLGWSPTERAGRPPRHARTSGWRSRWAT